jgi:glycosyltransferase involved in cell wall biosynthesis
MTMHMVEGDPAGTRRPGVSIILPTYNRAEFLPQAFASIRSQHFQDWELIVVDDGSTDNTQEIVEKLSAGIQQQVRCIYQANLGAYGARNTGLNLAKGHYIAFFDSDDYWLEHHLENCVRALEANQDVDWVYGACRVIEYRTGRVLAPSTFYLGDRPRPFLNLHFREGGKGLRIIKDGRTLRCLISDGLFCGLQNSVIRRQIFSNRRFCTRYPNEGEDVLMAVTAAEAKSTFAYFDCVHVLYNVHDSNTTDPGGKASLRKMLKMFLIALKRCDEIRGELNLRPAEERALNRMLARHYFWSVGYALLLQHGNGREALSMFHRGLWFNPWNPFFWKTYILVQARMIFRKLTASSTAGVSTGANCLLGSSDSCLGQDIFAH